MKVKSLKTILFLIILGHVGYAVSGTTPSDGAASADAGTAKEEVSMAESALTGDSEAGEKFLDKK